MRGVIAMARSQGGWRTAWNTPVLLRVVRSPSWQTSRRSAHQRLAALRGKNVYRVDQTWLGYLVASFGGGALIGRIAAQPCERAMRLTALMIFATLTGTRAARFAQMPGRARHAVS
jgi:hypothetical protein